MIPLPPFLLPDLVVWVELTIAPVLKVGHVIAYFILPATEVYDRHVAQGSPLKINLGLLLHLLKKRLFLSIAVANPTRCVPGTSRSHFPHHRESMCLRMKPTEKGAEVETQISYSAVSACRYTHA